MQDHLERRNMMACNVTGVLSIVIVRGEGFSRCDPYVQIVIDSCLVSQTRVGEKAQSAQWDQMLAFSLEGKEKHIQFQLYDWDRFTADDKQGETEPMGIADFVRNFEGKGPQWINLKNGKGRLQIELRSVFRQS